MYEDGDVCLYRTLVLGVQVLLISSVFGFIVSEELTDQCWLGVSLI